MISGVRNGLMVFLMCSWNQHTFRVKQTLDGQATGVVNLSIQGVVGFFLVKDFVIENAPITRNQSRLFHCFVYIVTALIVGGGLKWLVGVLIGYAD